MFTKNSKKEIPLVSAPGTRQLVLPSSCAGAVGAFPTLMLEGHF